MEKLFICLANSKKYTERCIAGIELAQSSRQGDKDDGVRIVRTENKNPKLIRPVSTAQSGAVPSALVDHVSLLELVKLNVTASAPQGYQSENVLFDDSPLEIIGRIPKSASSIEKLLSVKRRLLFGNRGKAVSVEDITQLHHSLVLIKPENAKAYQTTNVAGNPQIRAEFVYNGHSYDLPITDIDFNYRFSNNSTLLDSCTHIYFTISLGVEFQGRHYKLIAGVIYILVMKSHETHIPRP